MLKWHEGIPMNTRIENEIGLIEIFRTHATESPDRVGIIDGNQKWTYRQVDDCSDQVAQQLILKSVRPGQVVAVCMERSAELVFVLLGIWKAGACYVPIDINNPVSRRNAILDNAQACLWIGGSNIPDSWKASDVPWCLADELLKPAPEAMSALQSDLQKPFELACIIYTSGTTGIPKGVEVTQQGIIRLTQNTRYVKIGPQDRFGNVSNPAFDALSFDLWGAMLNGASLVVFSNQDLQSPQAFAEKMRLQRVSVMFVTVSLFNLLVKEEPQCFSTAKQVLIGGEQLNSLIVKEFYENNPQSSCQLINGYGPTECTTFAVCFPIDRKLVRNRIPIGFPIDQTEAQVIVDGKRQAEPGEQGELYLSGAGVARGYRGLVEETEKKFVTLPDLDDEDTIYYRTGDLACWNNCGQLECFGRIDQQVKVRGFRMELEEIEHHLSTHPEVQQCLLAVHQNAHGTNDLYAFLVFCDPKNLKKVVSTDLRRYLEEKIPPYMIPHRFFQLNAIPLTANGKADRARALVQTQRELLASTSVVGPQGDIAKTLLGICRTLLENEQLSLDDSFIHGGGDSLKAMRLAAEIRVQFSVDLPMHRLLSASTLNELIGNIQQAKKLPDFYPPLPTLESHEAFAASSEQYRLWFLQKLNPQSVAYNIPLAFQLQGEVDEEALKSTLQQLTDRHPALRTRFVLGSIEEPDLPPTPSKGLMQQVLPAVEMELTIHSIEDQNHQTGWHYLAEILFSKAFDLSQAPLFRAGLIHIFPGRSILLFNFHHIVMDGWSLNLIYDDFCAIYNSRVKRLPSVLGRPGSHYFQYCAWQQALFQSASYQEELNFWRRRLLRHAQNDQFSTESDALSQSGESGQVLHFEVGIEVMERLQRLSDQENITSFGLMLTGYSLLLSQYLGRSDIAIGSPVANRALQDFESVVGMFANTAVFHLDLPQRLPLKDLLGLAHEAILQTQSHQDVAYEHAASCATSRKGAAPLFDFMFVLENTRPEPMQLEGLEIECELLPVPLAKFPLLLSMTETPTGLQGFVEFQTARFSTEVVEQMISSYVQILERLTGNLEKPLEPAALLSAKNQAAISQVSEGNVNQLPFASITRWFEIQAEHSSEQVALQYGNAQVTYGQLNAQANRLAHFFLENQSWKSGETVALHMSPSFETVVAMLALSKMGISLLHLDQNYPAALMQQVLKIAEVKAVLLAEATSIPNALKVEESISLIALNEVLAPDSVESPLDFYSTENLKEAPQADDPLYMVFTSGSTGTPKGVAVKQMTLINLLNWQNRTLKLRSAAKTLQFSALPFDVSMQEIFSTLCGGGTLCLIDEPLRKDHVGLLKTLDALEIERIHLPYIALQSLADVATRLGQFPRHLQEVITAGEQLYCNEAIKALFQELEGARLFNQYGPSETHVVSCLTLDGPPAHWPLRPAIGKPIDNVANYVVDNQVHPLPVGARGEIAVAGPGVQRCYAQNPEANANRFAMLEHNQGEHLVYKTGDLGFYQPNGDLVFLERNDDQLKINGYRIETGQIEAVLLQNERVQAAVVMLSENNKQLVAYLQPHTAGKKPEPESLRQLMQEHLPSYMAVRSFRLVERFTQTSSGKINRRQLEQGTWTPLEESGQNANGSSLQISDLETQIQKIFQFECGVALDVDKNFFEGGATSLLLVKVHVALIESVAPSLNIVDLFAHPTIRELATHLQEKVEPRPTSTSSALLSLSDSKKSKGEKVAVIGMALGLPGAQTLSEFWDVIDSGTECIEFFDDGTTEDSSKIRARSSLQGIFDFDPEYFGVNAKEAQWMAPQHRHFLMGSVHALENAGYDPDQFEGKIGVVASCGENTYHQGLWQNADKVQWPDGFQTALHHEKDFLATKVAYHLNLRGPAITVQSACSSSLIAIHQACQQLRSGESEMALAGGVLIDPSNQEGYDYKPGHIFSKDGHCKPFSAEASGTIGASGYGLVVLKPLEKALEDNDRIYATIEGSAVNNDGRKKVSYTAPSVEGQADVISQALQAAGLTADQVSYVEAHGTGTELGDPIEIEALTQSFRRSTEATGYCAVSSLKSQMGHLGAAAGVAGLIRAALSVYHQTLPPNLGFDRPNLKIDFEPTPFFVNAKSQPWEATHRFAGVSSFGIGGSNAHVIVGEAPILEKSAQEALLPWDLAPTPFQLQLCEVSADLELPQRQGFSQWLHQVSWHRAHRIRQVEQKNRVWPSCFLVFADLQQEAKSIRDSLRQQGARVVYVEAGNCFAQVADDHFSIDLTNLEDYKTLMASLKVDSGPMEILHFAHVAPMASSVDEIPLQLACETGLKGFVHLMQAFESEFGNRALTIRAFANQVVDVFGNEETRPEASLLWGPALVIPQEFPNVRFQMVDLPSVEFSKATKIKDAMVGLLSEGEPENGPIALRNGYVWKRSFHAIDFPVPDQETPLLRDQGVYLITGGLGGLGRVFLEQLATLNQVQLIVLSRTIPDPLDEELLALKKSVDRLEIIACDVADEASVIQAACQIKEHYNSLNGIIHAAGTPGGGLIHMKCDEALESVLAPKVWGSVYLERHLAELCPEFVVHCSSMSAIHGGTGQIDYCAANNFQDAWAAHCNRHGSSDTLHLSINWDVWKETGMARSPYQTENRLSRLHEAHRQRGISPQEGQRLLEAALNLQLPQLLTSTTSLEAASVFYSSLHQNPHEIEEQKQDVQLKDLFCLCLGCESVDSDESFFDLGGDSLLGLDLLELVNHHFSCGLTLDDLTHASTIDELMELIEPENSEAGEGPSVLLKAGSDEHVLFLIHPIGGDVLAYRSLVSGLGIGGAIYAIADPGLSEEVPDTMSIEARAALYLEQIQQSHPKASLALAGWSFGGLVAHEMARQLEEAKTPARAVFMIDPASPEAASDFPDPSAEQLQSLFLKELGEESQDRPSSQGAQARAEQVSRVCLSNLQSLREFRPSRAIDTPVHLFVARTIAEDLLVGQNGHDLLHQWQSWIGGPLRSHWLDADHYSIMQGDHAKALAAWIQQALEEGC